MSDRMKEVATPGLVFTAALGIGLAIYWVNRRRVPYPKVNPVQWLTTKFVLRSKQILLINNREQSIAAVNSIVRECSEHRYVGFDCEWVPQRGRGTKHHPVALLQLATPKGTCLLFRLCRIGFLPEEIKALLRDPTLLKVGVAPMDDARLLLRDFGAQVHGCLDLRFLHQSHVKSSQSDASKINTDQSGIDLNSKTSEIQNLNNTKSTGDLKKCNKLNSKLETAIEQSELKLLSNLQPISKDDKSQNFESKTEDILLNSQVENNSTICNNKKINNSAKNQSFYIQAGGGLGLARMTLEVLGVELDKNWRIRCSNWEAKELSQAQIEYAANDALVSALMFAKFSDLETSWWPPWKSNKPKANWAQAWQRWAHFIDVGPKCRPSDVTLAKERKLLAYRIKPQKNFSRSVMTRSKPLYDNCFLQAPDGEVLCTCDKKKAEWYISKGIADKVDTEDDSLTVRLKFEPSGRSGKTGKYYTLLKVNVCVVCGRDDSYTRKNVVPHEYRKFFPKELKNHQSHDVLLLCLACGQRANATEIALRNQLATKCDAPFGIKEHSKLFCNPELNQLRSGARALLNTRSSLPASRITEYTLRVAAYFNISQDDVTEVHLTEAASLEVTFENSSYISHGQKVVQYYQSREGIFELEKLWRQHFLKAMKPKYLPELWSIEHKQE